MDKQTYPWQKKIPGLQLFFRSEVVAFFGNTRFEQMMLPTRHQRQKLQKFITEFKKMNKDFYFLAILQAKMMKNQICDRRTDRRAKWNVVKEQGK